MPPNRRRRLALACVVALAGSALSCGASIQALYEGDVRFEHCMALDARPDVKPTLRRTCWIEWVQFYTFGQTRDRIDYARQRELQLGAASDFDQADWVPTTTGPRAVPDPTSAIAPPPMMMVATDGGAMDASALADARSPGGACLGECQQALDACHRGCKGPGCDRACAARRDRCAKRCK